MDVTVALDTGDGDEITVTISDDHSYTPEVVSDICRRAGDEAIRMHRELHPADADS